MDKIKNVFSSNTAKNDEAPHGSGRELGTTTHSGGLTGEGSHLAQANTTTAGTGSGGQTLGVANTAEGSHLAQAHNTTAGTTSGLTGTSGDTYKSNTNGQNHLARDAAVAASGVGVAEHEHRKHENEQGVGSTTTGQGIENTQSVGNTQGTEHSSNTANEPPNASSIGAGSAAYTGTNQGSSYHTGPAGTAVEGPHSTNTANRLDPAINTSGTTSLENAHEHSERHGGGGQAADKHHLGRDAAVGGGLGAAAYEADKHHHHSEAKEQDPLASRSQPTTSAATNTTADAQSFGTANQANTGVDSNRSKDHHYGRDAAVVTGAAGLAEHEHHKHDKDLTQAERDAKKEHKHELKQEKKDHHYGRDAAVAGGAGGLAEHEHHHRENVPVHDSGTTSAATSSTKDASLLPGPAPNTAGPHKKDWMNKLDPFVDSHPTSATSDADIRTLPARSGQGSIDQEGHHTPRGEVGQGFAGSTATGHESTTDGKSHHLGRDTVVAGGVGAAAYEADKHHRKDEIAQPTAGQSTIHPSTTTTGPRSSAVGADTSKDHHYGRDAAVAGGVGGAAYEAEKHHKHDKDLTQAERDAKKEHKHELKEEKKHKHEEKEKKGGLLGFLHRDKNKSYTPEEEAEFDRQEREHHDSHKGRDAGIAAGAGAGAGALYASDKHQYAGQTADTNKSLPTAPGNNGIGTGAGTQNALAGDSTSSSHHYGRDAALGAGAVGAADVAEHEHNTHSGPTPLAEKPKGKDLGDILHGVERNRGVPGSSGYPGTEGYGTGIGGALAGTDASQAGRSEATTDQAGHPLSSTAGSELGATGQHRKTDSGYAAGSNDYSGSHQTGDNITLPGSTGLAHDYEYRKQDTTSGLMGSNTQPEFTDSNITGVNESVDGRNRLHKHPPAGHPASQDSYVPADSAERVNMVSEGKSIDKDTGVANSHATGGVNAATNY